MMYELDELEMLRVVSLLQRLVGAARDAGVEGRIELETLLRALEARYPEFRTGINAALH